MKYFRVSLRSDGEMLWHPGGIYKTSCPLDVTYFPFDTQVNMLFLKRFKLTLGLRQLKRQHCVLEYDIKALQLTFETRKHSSGILPAFVVLGLYSIPCIPYLPDSLPSRYPNPTPRYSTPLYTPPPGYPLYTLHPRKDMGPEIPYPLEGRWDQRYPKNITFQQLLLRAVINSCKLWLCDKCLWLTSRFAPFKC